MERIGIRELRQNLSIHLRRVKLGESLEVTERGRPVAVLSPLGEGTSVRERLLLVGSLKPASASIAALQPPLVLGEGSISATEALNEARAERL